MSCSVLIFSDEDNIAKLAGDMWVSVSTDCFSYCVIESDWKWFSKTAGHKYSIKQVSLNFYKIHGKTPNLCNYVEKRLQLRCFSCKFWEFFIDFRRLSLDFPMN